MLPNTRDLIQRAKSGDLGACGLLVQTWEPVVRRVIRRIIHDAFDTDDLAQEVLVSAILRLPQIRDAGRSTQWVTAMARNAAVSFLRRPPVQRLLVEIPAVEDLQGDAEKARMRLLVRNAVARLSATRRDVVVRHSFRGLSYGETAGSLGVSVDIVRSRLQKARNALKEDIKTMANPKPEQYTLSPEDLSTLGHLAESTIVDAKWPALQGILFDTGGWAVATDGRRLLRRYIGGLRALAVPVVLGPWRGAEALFAAPGSTLLLDGRNASFRTSSSQIHDIPIMEVQYPKYETVLPSGAPLCCISVPVAGLRCALQTVVSETDLQRQPLTIEVSKEVLTIRKRWKELAAEVTVRVAASDCGCSGGLFKLCMEARYLSSAVRWLVPADGDAIRLSIYGQDRPALFALPRRERDIVVVMPLDPSVAA